MDCIGHLISVDHHGEPQTKKIPSMQNASRLKTNKLHLQNPMFSQTNASIVHMVYRMDCIGLVICFHHHREPQTRNYNYRARALPREPLDHIEQSVQKVEMNRERTLALIAEVAAAAQQADWVSVSACCGGGGGVRGWLSRGTYRGRKGTLTQEGWTAQIEMRWVGPWLFGPYVFVRDDD